MAEAKTKPTAVSPTSYVAAIDDEDRRKDCKQLVAMMKKATGCAPKMWGTSIVGFDSYHYKYDSGHEGDSCVIGFSSRAGAISVYLTAYPDDAPTRALFAKLGKHKMAKACLYIKRLADVNLPVLEKLLATSVAENRRRYPKAK
jgi:hypothetical protein